MSRSGDVYHWYLEELALGRRRRRLSTMDMLCKHPLGLSSGSKSRQSGLESADGEPLQGP